MDTDPIADEAVLVNFRAPKSVIETLDQLSRFHHKTRTSILLDLITSWINERTYDIPLKVRQLTDLKTALNAHEQSVSGNRKSIGSELIKISHTDRSEREPLRFFKS